MFGAGGGEKGDELEPDKMYNRLVPVLVPK
jgi:hypothetical protein